jgi:hypothetical protein
MLKSRRGWLASRMAAKRSCRLFSRRRGLSFSSPASSGDTIPLGRRTLRVVDVRDDETDQPPVLVVEDT